MITFAKFIPFFALPKGANKQKTPQIPMSTSQKSSHPFVQRSSLYQEFLAEREEILRHKWLESEKAGYDIGFEKALLDWIMNHRDSWRSHRRGNGETMRRQPSHQAAL